MKLVKLLVSSIEDVSQIKEVFPAFELTKTTLGELRSSLRPSPEVSAVCPGIPTRLTLDNICRMTFGRDEKVSIELDS
jgi:hypothetical protein